MGERRLQREAMALTETFRQVLAGLTAAGVFLTAYFGLSLTVLVSVVFALLAFVAVLLLVRRAAPPAERVLADGVTAGDLDTALLALSTAAGRLRGLEDRAPAGDRGVFGAMADILERIRAHHAHDPRDLRHTRRFLRHDLPRLVETSETYVDLAARSGVGASDRLAQLSQLIRSFSPALEKIDQACLENDFMKLEVEAEVLSEQLERRYSVFRSARIEKSS